VFLICCQRLIAIRTSNHVLCAVSP
jgi:hypothetical protein